MANASNQDGYDPFRIDSIAEIDQILLDIIKQGSLVRMHGGNADDAVITTLVSIDFDNDLLFIDSAAQQHINEALITNGTAHCETQANNVSIEFRVSNLRKTMHEGHETLVGMIPHFLRRIQRRDSFRVQPHTINPAICTLQIEEETIRLPVFDISASGVSLLDKYHVLESHDIPKGYVFKDSTLTLPGIGDIEIDLKLVRQQTQGSSMGKNIARYGYAFFSFKAADRIRVQNYIDQEERQRIARDRGLA